MGSTKGYVDVQSGSRSAGSVSERRKVYGSDFE